MMNEGIKKYKYATLAERSKSLPVKTMVLFLPTLLTNIIISELFHTYSHEEINLTKEDPDGFYCSYMYHSMKVILELNCILLDCSLKYKYYSPTGFQKNRNKILPSSNDFWRAISSELDTSSSLTFLVNNVELSISTCFWTPTLQCGLHKSAWKSENRNKNKY